MEIGVEDDERTLTMVEDLGSEDVAGNSSCHSPAPLADDDGDAAAAAAAASVADTSTKSVKDNKEKILTELEEATDVNAEWVNFLPLNKSQVSWFRKRSCWNLLVLNAKLLLMTTCVAGN